MRLQTKITTVILVTWGLMFAAVYLGSRTILERSYLQLEDQQTVTNVNRALQAMDQMAESVGLIASSNAVWDDAYKFAEDKNPEFIKANLQLTSLVGFGTDMLLFFNAAGQPVYYAVTNEKQDQLIGLPAGFETYLTPKSKLVYMPNLDSEIQGLVSIPSNILLVAAHVIVKGDNTGPVHGSLVAVRYFTTALMEKLRQVTKLELAIFRKPEIDKDPVLQKIFSTLSQQDVPVIEKEKQVLHGYAYLKDINGTPFGIIKITTPRGIYAIGKQSIKYFSLAFLSAGIIFVLLLMYLFRVLVTKRLEKLNDQVVEIGQTKEFSTRLREEGSDELTSVQIEINKMMGIIQTDTAERVKLSEKLSQAEKLASIGVLTAGVAHEINNPINFVMSTIDPLKDDISDILTILKKYLELKTDAEFAEHIEGINKIKDEVNVEYTMEEIDRLLKGIKDGATRTARIVNDLKSFSRHDENAMKKSNIHEGLDSTLTLLKHNYANRIKIVKDYGDIPEVDCFPGKINQVFMNVLSNAIDAIPGAGEIKITTRKEGKNVVISIKDTGIGISPDNIPKIFEPFYTTKDVGKGTGLGLSISFGIIRDHNGSIEVKSREKEGTEFIITLPIEQWE